MADQNDKPIDGTANGNDHDTPLENTSFKPQSDYDAQEDAASDAADDARTTASAGASGAAQTLKDGAAKITQTVGEKAKTYVEDGKTRAGSALDELAQMMHDAAGTVDDKVGAQYGQYARTAADAVTGFSDSLKSKNVDDLIADATNFVKKSPAIAIGTAAALGFVLIRLVQAGINADSDGA